MDVLVIANFYSAREERRTLRREEERSPASFDIASVK